MRERVCNNCGGKRYRVVGQNMVKCEFCGSLYVDEQASKEEEVLIVGAYEKLRAYKFAEAVDEFDKIIALFPMSFEAYFGKALAKNKIIFYNNKRNLANRPRICGDEIPSLFEDEDFKQAIKLAPPETAKIFTDKAKRIDNIIKGYQQTKSKNYDVIVCAVDYQKNEENSLVAKAVEELKLDGLDVYFFQGDEQREKEDETFRALETAKVLVFFINKEKGLTSGEIKHIYDRYLNKILLKQKTRSSFIVALDKSKGLALPKELKSCKSVIDSSSISFLQDLKTIVAQEIKNSDIQTAKIEMVKLEGAKPGKKEYVDIETLSPSDLGNFHVDNVELDQTNKIKWIFLCIKNGDFSTARELIDAELEKDPYNSELLLADLMENKKIKTQEELFSNISNFSEKEKIDKILTYASKEFAEGFVDRWEELIMSYDNVDYLNTYLIYLAQYNTPKRVEFLKFAENKAVETLNDELIQKVLKCFDKSDVERFVNFYFLLAQKSDDEEYYKKILEIDQGHEQSNLTVLLQHFVTVEDKLTYRNKEEIENVLRFLSDEAKSQFVATVVNMILPIAFYDLEKAQSQLDFYLSYVTDAQILSTLLKRVAENFQQQGFFKIAEKYLSIAISKDSQNAELYWLLIKIKAHCKSDQEIITSNVKISQLPEWQTLLSISNENQVEEYAEIVSKSNLYKGAKAAFAGDRLDKVELVEKLKEFLLRNEKILLEVSKQQDGLSHGVEYFKMQLKPFESYISQLNYVQTFEEFVDLTEKIDMRLQALELDLNSSVSITHLSEKEEGMKNIYTDSKVVVQKVEEQAKAFKRKEFLKKYLFIFLELVPLLFTVLLLTILLFSPKEVYLYFSQDFLVVSVLFSLIVAFLNFVLYKRSKHNATKMMNFSKISLICLGILNFILMIVGFYFMPNVVEIDNAKHMQALLKNAGNCNFELVEDLDMAEVEWQSVNFSGNFNANNHTISNLKFASDEHAGLFKTNSGVIQNLNIVLSEHSYENIGYFAPLVMVNSGQIKNCTVQGAVSLTTNVDTIIGGLVGRSTGGEIEGCDTNLTIFVDVKAEKVFFGGLVGDVVKGDQISITSNTTNTNLTLNADDVQKLYVGGLIGNIENYASTKQSISKNATEIEFVISGQSGDFSGGGLVGNGKTSSKNNYSQGNFNVLNLTGGGYVGGLYGRYQNSDLKAEIIHSYANVTIFSNAYIKQGQLIGGLGGKVKQCFATGNSNLKLVSTPYLHDFSNVSGCLILTDKFYDSSLQFDEDVWVVTESDYPRLK